VSGWKVTGSLIEDVEDVLEILWVHVRKDVISATSWVCKDVVSATSCVCKDVVSAKSCV
jgi:hypothetical protein